MGKVSIKGVLIGGIVDVSTSVVLGLPFVVYIILKIDPVHLPKDRVQDSVNAAIHGNLPLYVTMLLVGFACSALGGYVAARLAKHDERLNGALSSFLCVALGILTIVLGKGRWPGQRLQAAGASHEKVWPVHRVLCDERAVWG